MGQERDYRSLMGQDLSTFQVAVAESDLWIGIDASSYRPKVEVLVLELVEDLRCQLEDYIKSDSGFLTALEPYPVRAGAPEIAVHMAEAARTAGVGPMAAVAGAFAHEVGEKLVELTGCRKLIVENGGDIYIYGHEPVTVSIFAGASPFSYRIGAVLQVDGRLGVCTSSGTVGHSLSFGRADAVMVVSEDAVVADALATAYCNVVQVKEDIDRVLLKAQESGLVRGAVVILGSDIGVWGNLELVKIDR